MEKYLSKKNRVIATAAIGALGLILIIVSVSKFSGESRGHVKNDLEQRTNLSKSDEAEEQKRIEQMLKWKD